MVKQPAHDMAADFRAPPDFELTDAVRKWLLERFTAEDVDAMSREAAFWELMHGDC